MTPEAVAILGLFLGLWSHELIHRYDETGRKGTLRLSIFLGIGSLLALGSAAVRAVFG